MNLRLITVLFSLSAFYALSPAVALGKDFQEEGLPSLEHPSGDVVPESSEMGFRGNKNVAESFWTGIHKKTKNAVVQIFTQTFTFNWLEPYRAPEQSGCSGSGFFINNAGYIVTNYHVIEEAGHIAIQIPFFGQKRFDVELIGACPERDIALLKLTDDAFNEVTAKLGSINYLTLGNSDALQRGQEVMAVGYPLGQYSVKTTHGMISGRERISLLCQSCFQISAPINPGSSGGPVLDAQGTVIGVTFAGNSNAQNVGYIIPINEAEQAINYLFTHGLMRVPLLGCEGQRATTSLVDYLNNPAPGGYYLYYVLENSAVARTGLQVGDMVYSVNGLSMDSYGDITVPWSEDKMRIEDLLNRAKEGDPITVCYYRNGEERTASFNLETQTTLPIRFVYPRFEKVAYEVIGGLVVMELTLNHVPLIGRTSLKKFYLLENQSEPQLIIAHVIPTSYAKKAGTVVAGDLIDTVNGQKVRTLGEFSEAVVKTRETGFLSIKFQDKTTTVLSRKDIVKDEDRLASILGFDKSSLVTQLEN